MVLFLLLFIALFVVLYRNYKGHNIGKFITEEVAQVYNKFAPYSFKVVNEKTKQLGKEYTIKDYTIQVVMFSTFTGVITYMYFYNIIISIIYILYLTHIFCLYIIL